MSLNDRRIVRIFVLLRWITRVVSTSLVLFMIYMLLSYIAGPEKSVPGASMIVIISLFATGAGLAWIWEGLGGLIILVGSMLFFFFYPGFVFFNIGFYKFFS